MALAALNLGAIRRGGTQMTSGASIFIPRRIAMTSFVLSKL
jgi:hypothetical protein